MKSQSLESISINKRQINLKTCSGLAMGVQKYTKTHVRGSGTGSSVPYWMGVQKYGGTGLSVFSWIETIIEFSIQQANGNEIQVTLTGEEIRVRDGQRVSVIWGCRKGRRSTIIFVNHDDNNKWYWIGTPHSFFEYLEIFICFSEYSITSSIWGFIWVIFGINIYLFLTVNSIFSNFLNVTIVGIFLGAGIMFLIIQEYRVLSAWNIIKPQILKIVKQLNINSNSIC